MRSFFQKATKSLNTKLTILTTLTTKTSFGAIIMEIKGWKYYNHAAFPDVPPNEAPDLSAVKSGEIWKLDGSPLLARWVSDFDKLDGGEWWYVVKDTPFDISSLKAKRRYEINKGTKNFEVKEIDPTEYKEIIYNIQVAAFSAYPEKYRPTVERESFIASIDTWKEYVVLGAFSRDNGELCGYAMLYKETDGYVDFRVLKAAPSFEKAGINAALCAGVMAHFDDFLKNGGILCDGARAISHETHFQDYLEKNFGFRKAYCKLCIAYAPKMKTIVKMLYPFRKLLMKLDGNSKVHSINGVLKMESIVRGDFSKNKK